MKSNHVNMNFSSKNLKNYLDYLIEFLKKNLKKTKKTGYVIGVSTGIDSTLCAKLLTLTNNNNIYLYLYHRQNLEQKRAIKLLEKKFKINIEKINLAPIIKHYQKLFKNKNFNFTNLVPRIRMSILYLYANNEQKLVLGTSNFDEWNLGYFTKFGDGASDVQPLLKTPKKVIYLLAKFLKIPKYFLEKPPSADLYEGQTDEQELKFSYDDSFCYFFLDKEKIFSEKLRNIKAWKNFSFHKRNPLNFPEKFQEFFEKKN